MSSISAGDKRDINVLEWAVTQTPLHVLWAGDEAVLVFFILSGFVLMLPLLRGAAFDWRVYYPSRMVRLYVPVLASIALAIVWVMLVPRDPTSGLSSWLVRHDEGKTLAESVIDALVLDRGVGINSPLWSLRFEVLFSILLPAYAFVAIRFRRHWVSLAALAIAGSIVGQNVLEIGVARYLPVFALGVILAVNFREFSALAERIDRSSRPSLVWAVVAGASVVGLCLAWYPPPLSFLTDSVVQAVVLVSAVAVVFVVAFWGRARALFETRAVLWLGTISFSLYLTHEPILVSIGYLVPAHLVWLGPTIGIPVSILAGWLFYAAVERPSHKAAKAMARTISQRRNANGRAKA